MFGPNVKSDDSGEYYHHREKKFHTLLRELERVFVRKFGLDDYVVLFLTGSGTAANEAVIFSYNYRFDFWYSDAEFGRRLLRLSEAHRKNNLYSSTKGVALPLYETSISRLNVISPSCYESQTVFLDMVSAFPYYLPPEGTAFWTTVSSKQVGAYPVLGIVGIRKDLLKPCTLLKCVPNSSLSLTEQLRFREKNETLTTPAIPLFVDLLRVLKKFDRDRFVRKINERRRQIANLIGGKNIIGDGPVVTLENKSRFIPMAEKFNLYRNRNGNYQIFLWSGTDRDYDVLYRRLERTMNAR